MLCDNRAQRCPGKINYVVLEKTKANISRNNVLNIVLKLNTYFYLVGVRHNIIYTRFD